MRENHTTRRSIFGLIHALLLVAAFFAGNAAAQNNSDSPAGRWSGAFQTPGPSGALEIALARSENDWRAEVKIEVAENKILTKPARNVKVDGEKLSFTIELMGAEVTFSGSLRDDKLTGALEAVQDGKTVGMGSWQTTRAPR